MHLGISTAPSGSTALYFGLDLSLPPHLSATVGSPAHPNELRTRKTFGVCRTRMPQCTCIDGPFFLHFASARAKGKRSFRTDCQCITFFSELSALPASTIPDLTTDLSDIPTDLWSKPRELFAQRARNVIDQRTMGRLGVSGPNGRSRVDKGTENGRWEGFSVSIPGRLMMISQSQLLAIDPRQFHA